MATLRTTRIGSNKTTQQTVPAARRTSELIYDSSGNLSVIEKSAEEKLADVLISEHPVYSELSPNWQKYRTVYEGLSVNKYLYKHSRESQKSIVERKKRSYYLNYINQVVDIYSGFIYRQPITRTLNFTKTTDEKRYKEIFDHILENFDASGKHTAEEFFKDTSIWSLVYGTEFILVDMPDNVPDTFDEQKKQKAYPFAVKIDPNRVINWEVDTKGELLWVRLEEEAPPISDPFSNEIIGDSSGTSRYFKTWDRNKWYMHRVDEDDNNQKTAVKVGEGEHGLGVVPLVPVRSKYYSGSSVMGLSFIHDMASVAIAILNVCSLLDEEVYQKTLTLLAVQNTTTDQKAEVDIGSNNVISYTGTQPPQFISPSVTPGDFFSQLVEKLGQEIFRMGKLGGGTAVLQEAMSGIAHAYLFNETNQSLADQADNMQQAELKVLDLMRRWLKIDEGAVNISVKYPDEFGIVKVTDELEILKKTRQNIPSSELQKQLAKEVAQVLLQGVEDRQLIEQVMKEIDAGMELHLESVVEKEDEDEKSPKVKTKKNNDDNSKKAKSGESSEEGSTRLGSNDRGERGSKSKKG